MHNDNPTLQKRRALLQKLYAKRLKGLMLYGSCARGTAGVESDMDLLVLLEGPVDVAREIRRIWTVIYPIQLESDHLLSVVPVDMALYDRGEYALYRQAKAEGVAI
jgi:predicted nucleotidyltransferase